MVKIIHVPEEISLQSCAFTRHESVISFLKFNLRCDSIMCNLLFFIKGLLFLGLVITETFNLKLFVVNPKTKRWKSLRIYQNSEAKRDER